MRLLKVYREQKSENKINSYLIVIALLPPVG